MRRGAGGGARGSGRGRGGTGPGGARAGSRARRGLRACGRRSVLLPPGLLRSRGREGWRPGGDGVGSHGRAGGELGKGLRAPRPAGLGPERAGFPGLRARIFLRRGFPPSPTSRPKSRSGS